MDFEEKLISIKELRESKEDENNGLSWVTVELRDFDWMIKQIEDQRRDIKSLIRLKNNSKKN